MGFWVDPFYPKTVSNGNSIHGSKPVRHRAQTNFPGYINTYLKIPWQAKFTKSHKKKVYFKKDHCSKIEQIDKLFFKTKELLTQEIMPYEPMCPNFMSLVDMVQLARVKKYKIFIC